MLETFTSENQSPTKCALVGNVRVKSHVKENCSQVNVVFTQIASALVVNVVRMRLNVMGSLTTASILSLVHSIL